jgi:hypothetical protein
MKSIFFWDMTPCSALSGSRRFGGTYHLHLKGSRIVQQATRSSETSGTTQGTTRRHIPEEHTLQNHRCENLKSYINDGMLPQSNHDCFFPNPFPFIIRLSTLCDLLTDSVVKTHKELYFLFRVYYFNMSSVYSSPHVQLVVQLFMKMEDETGYLGY